MAITDQVPTPRAGGGLAIASLLTGIAAVFACGIGIVAGPAAIVLGVLAGKKGGFGARAIAGIVTGALGFVIWAGALVWLIVYASDDDDRTITTPTPVPATAQVDGDGGDGSAAPAAGLVLTEEGIAASGFPTAYAAYLETYGVSTAFDGMYAGDAIDTPCFTLAGEAWWVIQGTPETCDASSELWWETYSGVQPDEIKLFGSGGAGAGISFEAVTREVLATDLAASDVATFAAYVKDELIVPSGPSDIVESTTTLDGIPAVQFDVTFDALDAYRVYVVYLPDGYTVEGEQVGGFIIHAFNEAEWVYPSEDVVARLEGTFAWK